MLLSASHALADDADPTEDGLAGLEPADPDDPSAWRDWVQPAVFEDISLEELAATGATTASIGEGEVSARLPTDGLDWSPDEPRTAPELARHGAVPSQRRPPYRFSPSSLAAVLTGDAALKYDPVADEVVQTGEAATETESMGGPEETGAGSIPSTTFGDIVHKIVELQPPDDRWQSIAEGFLAEDPDADLEALDLQAVRQHVTTATSYLTTERARHDDCEEHAELLVTAEFEHGEVAGFIDILLVTEAGYHVIDLKTGRPPAETTVSMPEEYRTQLEAYAVALHASRPERPVRTTLLFTETGQTISDSYTPSELDRLTADLEARLDDHVASWLSAHDATEQY